MSVERRRKKRKKSNGIIIIFLISVFLLGIGYIAVRSLVLAIFVDVEQLTKTTVEETWEADFLVIRQEYNVGAPSPGRLELTVREGEKVPKGAIVGYLSKAEGTSLETTTRVPLQAPEAGVFSLQVDGLESICNPKRLNELDAPKLLRSVKESGLSKEAVTNEGQWVSSGQVIFKILDNLSPSYLFCQVDQPLSEQLALGSRVELQLNDLAAEPLAGVIGDSYEENGKSCLLIRISTVNNLEKYRQLEGTIILERYSRLVIPAKMLAEKEGISGVYLLKNGKTTWQPVEITARNEQQVTVTGLEEGQWIITTPKLVKEGQHIRNS